MHTQLERLFGPNTANVASAEVADDQDQPESLGLRRLHLLVGPGFGLEGGNGCWGVRGRWDDLGGHSGDEAVRAGGPLSTRGAAGARGRDYEQEQPPSSNF